MGLTACRPKAKRAPQNPPSSASVDAAVMSEPRQPTNRRYFAPQPVNLQAVAPIRDKAMAALQRALAKNADANDSMAHLARVVSDAPGSAVAALELTKAAQRAGDEKRFGRFARIAERASAAFPGLSKTAERVIHGQVPRHRRPNEPTGSRVGPTTFRRLDQVTRFDEVCRWLQRSFQTGHPPVEYVGEQDTSSIHCEQSEPQTFAADLAAVTAVVRVGTTDERLFGWVVVRARQALWLGPVVAESFAPAVHPHGNGFSIELQRTEAYKAGSPELTAYIHERSTILDVLLNEVVVNERNRVVVMTFDSPTPQSSQHIVVHSTTSRSLIDPKDTRTPRGYEHSKQLGKTLEETYRLEWGDNQVRLTPGGTSATGSKVITLFAES